MFRTYQFYGLDLLLIIVFHAIELDLILFAWIEDCFDSLCLKRQIFVAIFVELNLKPGLRLMMEYGILSQLHKVLYFLLIRL